MRRLSTYVENKAVWRNKGTLRVRELWGVFWRNIAHAHWPLYWPCAKPNHAKFKLCVCAWCVHLDFVVSLLDVSMVFHMSEVQKSENLVKIRDRFVSAHYSRRVHLDIWATYMLVLSSRKIRSFSVLFSCL